MATETLIDVREFAHGNGPYIIALYCTAAGKFRGEVHEDEDWMARRYKAQFTSADMDTREAAYKAAREYLFSF